MPFILGMFRSSKTRCRAGSLPWRRISSASRPFCATWIGLVSLFFAKARRTFITSTASSSTSRISRGFSDTVLRLSLGLGPRESERGAAAFPGLDPGPPALVFDDLAHDAQADARPFHDVPWFEGLEDHPDALVKLGGDAGAVVGHRKLEELAGVRHPHHDFRLRAFAVLERVADQVHEHLLQRHALGTQRRHTLTNFDDRPRRRGAQLDDLAQQALDRYPLELGADPASSAVVEDAVDQTLHALHAVAQQLELLPGARRDRVPQIFLEPL